MEGDICANARLNILECSIWCSSPIDSVKLDNNLPNDDCFNIKDGINLTVGGDLFKQSEEMKR